MFHPVAVMNGWGPSRAADLNVLWSELWGEGADYGRQVLRWELLYAAKDDIVYSVLLLTGLRNKGHAVCPQTGPYLELAAEFGLAAGCLAVMSANVFFISTMADLAPLSALPNIVITFLYCCLQPTVLR